jgi:predicted nucleotidyltransferase
MSAILINMDLSLPWAPIRTRVDIEVLHVLCGTTRPLTGREVARLVRRGSQPTVNASLRRLGAEGLVHADEAGNAFLHSLNREHLAAPAVELLADISSELRRRLRDEIAAWEIAPVHAALFGSAARGDGDTLSNIDIFVVRPGDVTEDDPAWREQLNRLSDRVRSWTGNHAALSEISVEDVRWLRRERPPVVEDLRRDAITLAGATSTELLGTTQ